MHGELIYGGRESLCMGGEGGVIHGRHFGFVITVFIVYLYKYENKQPVLYGIPVKWAYIWGGEL